MTTKKQAIALIQQTYENKDYLWSKEQLERCMGNVDITPQTQEAIITEILRTEFQIQVKE